MRKLWFVFSLLLCSVVPAHSQALIRQQSLANANPTAVATDSKGFVYMAGNSLGDFPLTSALESQPPQGALELSVNGAPFVNTRFSAQVITAMAASSDGSMVLAAAGQNVFRSTNGGVTWNAGAVLGDLFALAVDPANASVAYALQWGGTLMQSLDGGMTWQSVASPPGLMRAGGPWQMFPGGGAETLTIDPLNPGRLYIWCSPYLPVFGPGTVYTNAGGGWTPLPTPVNGQIAAFALAPSQSSVLYAVAGPAPNSSGAGALLRSADGGANWTTGASLGSGYNFGVLTVDPADPSTVWVTNAGEILEKSTDGGATLQPVSSLTNNQVLSVAIDPANHLRVYASTTTGIWETNDGGTTWSTALSSYGGDLYAAPSRVFEFGNVPPTVVLAKLTPDLSQVVYSTYLWSGSVSSIAVDSEDNVALAGSAGSGGIVMKVKADDSSLLYTTVLNGTPNALAVDAQGNAVVVGSATNLAVTKGAYQSAPPGPCTRPTNASTGQPLSLPGNAFVAKLNASGALVYATYLTGSCGSSGYGLAVDSAGNAYVAGETYSLDFPVTPNAMAAKFPGVTSSGFVSELSPAGNLLYSSFLGGGGYTAVHAVTLDGAGNIYLAGSTEASSTAGAAQALSGGVGCVDTVTSMQGDDAFVLKMTPTSAPAAFLATLGGSCTGEADSIALDADGNIWLAGVNGSEDFPTRATIGALQLLNGAAISEIEGYGFLAELDAKGSTVESATVTPYGPALAADSTAVYFAGSVYGAAGLTALLFEISPGQVAPISLDEIVQYSLLAPPAQRLPTSVAPGQIVRILGRGIGPQNGAGAKLTAAGALATSLAGVSVTFNGVPAPLLGAQASQIICIAPFELVGSSTVVVEVQYNGQTSNTYPVWVLPQNPDLLSVLNSDWTVNSASNPAKPGSQIAIFMTGLGQTVPPSADGAINRPPLAQLQTEPLIFYQVYYQSAPLPQYVPSDLSFIGAAAFEVAGVYQLNLMVPSPAPPSYGIVIDQTVTPVYVAQ
jgi:uncharacterized protein (TIGR03437 family)